ncbi:MAG: methyl-accepting chemotaxis protein [Desulfococcaceae bacterium]
MLKKMSLTQKLILSNFFPVMLIVILGCVATFSIKSLLNNNYWVGHTHEVINNILRIKNLIVDMETGERGFLITGNDKFLEPYIEGKKNITELIEVLKKKVNDNPEQVTRLGKIEKNINSWVEKVSIPEINARKDVISGSKTMNDIVLLIESGTGKKMMDELRSQINEFTDTEQRLMVIRNADSEKSGKQSENIMIAGTVFTVIIILSIAYFISKGIAKPVNRSVESLIEISENVASSAVQTASASQQLAEKTSEQAASLEEAVSSLEQISSMTGQNAENIKNTDNIMKNVRHIVKKADDSMGRLTNSMAGISDASEKIRKIIKTIDEIAFQTNLLALNAAVEAARAGETGAGFAVVADEVRNLAMRAASEAKNTANLIEDTIRKVRVGTEYVAETNESFSDVVKNVADAVNLLADISAASDEQKRGVEQVNIAVSEMDKIVQQNASNAEESASASEEMNALSEKMKEVVKELVFLVKGGNETIVT